MVSMRICFRLSRGPNSSPCLCYAWRRFHHIKLSGAAIFIMTKYQTTYALHRGYVRFMSLMARWMPHILGIAIPCSLNEGMRTRWWGAWETENEWNFPKNFAKWILKWFTIKPLASIKTLMRVFFNIVNLVRGLVYLMRRPSVTHSFHIRTCEKLLLFYRFFTFSKVCRLRTVLLWDFVWAIWCPWGSYTSVIMNGWSTASPV